MDSVPGYNFPVLVERKTGTWVESESEVVGVECPFCGTWAHLAGPMCENPNCGAHLRGVKHTRPNLIIIPRERNLAVAM